MPGIVGLLLIVFSISFLLRIFYAGHLYQDDGLWFTAAEQLNRGKALYREIYFDKPPLLPLVYAALFRLFGAHILVIRLFTIAYVTAISLTLYGFAARLYDRRIGVAAAIIFSVFSTTYVSGHFQGLNTDVLMSLPYAAGALLFLIAGATGGRGRAMILALSAGVLTALAFQANPKGGFNLIFFGLWTILGPRLMGSKRQPSEGGGRPVAVLLVAMGGFVGACLPFIAYIAARRSLSGYWSDVWIWGSRYAGYYPVRTLIVQGIRQYGAYFALNNLLLFGLIAVIWFLARRPRRQDRAGAARVEESLMAQSPPNWVDSALLVWLGISILGTATGGRFFGHYFFQVLPALCLLGGRGLALMAHEFRNLNRVWLRRAAAMTLVCGVGVTMIRFHSRTMLLAADWISGNRAAHSADWLHQKLNHEEREVAAVIRNMPDTGDAVDRTGLEAYRLSATDAQIDGSGAGTLFVWGYRPELYYWTGLVPASRFLSTQPLTGVPADVQYINGETRSILDEPITQAARLELAEELNRARPRYIVDEVGMFNNSLAIGNYPEFRGLLGDYKVSGTVERFRIYRRREPKNR